MRCQNYSRGIFIRELPLRNQQNKFPQELLSNIPQSKLMLSTKETSAVQIRKDSYPISRHCNHFL